MICNHQTLADRQRVQDLVDEELRTNGYPSWTTTEMFFPIRKELASGIKNFVPQYLKLKFSNTTRGAITLDTPWAQNIYDYVHEHGTEQELDDILFRLNPEVLISYFILHHAECLCKEAYGEPLNAVLIDRLNEQLRMFTDQHYRDLNAEQLRPGLNFRSVALNVLGVEAALPYARVFEGVFFKPNPNTLMLILNMKGSVS